MGCISEEEFRARLVEMEKELILLREENIKLKTGGKSTSLCSEVITCKYTLRNFATATIALYIISRLWIIVSS